jgi:hypothetical protein
MGREGSGGTPIDDAPRDGRKNTDVRSVPNANAKSSSGSTPEIEADAKLASGYQRIEAAESAGGGNEPSVTDPAGPEGRAGYGKGDSVNFIRSDAPEPATEDIGEVTQ